jgi:hypothetical protein
MELFREEMVNVLQTKYGLPEYEARQCLASYWPDFLREHLELRMVDSHGYLIPERVTECSHEEFASVPGVVQHLIDQWFTRRRHYYPNGRPLPPPGNPGSNESQWIDPPWFPES